jgi:hypothetical protein
VQRWTGPAISRECCGNAGCSGYWRRALLRTDAPEHQSWHVAGCRSLRRGCTLRGQGFQSVTHVTRAQSTRRVVARAVLVAGAALRCRRKQRGRATLVAAPPAPRPPLSLLQRCHGRGIQPPRVVAWRALYGVRRRRSDSCSTASHARTQQRMTGSWVMAIVVVAQVLACAMRLESLHRVYSLDRLSTFLFPPGRNVTPRLILPCTQHPDINV